jgi:hypothetical protein
MGPGLGASRRPVPLGNKGTNCLSRSDTNSLYVRKWKSATMRLAQNRSPEMITAVKQVMRDLKANVVSDNVGPSEE